MVSLGIQPVVSTYCNRLNFNFQGGVLGSQNPNCQDLPKFQFSGWGGGWGWGWGWGDVVGSQNPKCQDLLNFNLGEGGGCSGKSKLKSAKICLNFIGGGEGGVVLGSQNPKCQDLPKFQFLGGGEFWEVKTQSAKICPNFIGGGVFWEVKPKVPRSAQISMGGGGGCSGTKSQKRVFWRIWLKISGSMCFGSLACWCITDSLSHTTYVETNKVSSHHRSRCVLKNFMTPVELLDALLSQKNCAIILLA